MKLKSLSSVYNTAVYWENETRYADKYAGFKLDMKTRDGFVCDSHLWVWFFKRRFHS